jgi:urate oxidase
MRFVCILAAPVGDYAISYGKAAVPVYRHGAAPLRGLREIPESGLTGRSNGLFAAEVDVEVLGDNFLPAYTEGDNSAVVATDSMKNFVLRETGTWPGATLESLLEHLGRKLLETYEQMDGLRVRGRQIRFDAVGGSEVLLSRSRDDRGTAELRLVREGSGVRTEGLRSAREGIELLKLRGSAFTSFVRDGYTTLPERRDRPLYIRMDVGWRYLDAQDALGDDPGRYVDSEQVRDLCAAVFDGFVSESIQHLVNEMGGRALERFPTLAEIAFEARNLTRDPVVEGVYTDPFPAYGTIGLTLRR